MFEILCARRDGGLNGILIFVKYKMTKLPCLGCQVSPQQAQYVEITSC